jgi:hypothetical protein
MGTAAYGKVSAPRGIYSVRIDLDWRAVGVVRDTAMVWFWIGRHQVCERLLGAL